MLNGCSKSTDETDGPAAVKIELDTSSVVTSSSGEKKQLTITCNSPWQITGGAEWVECSQTSGTNSATVSFTTQPNTTFDERRATYMVESGTTKLPFIVVQKQQDALTVTTNKIELPTAGCDFNIEVKANIPFDYEIGNDCKEWISRVDKTRTLQSSVLTFHAQPSEDADTRSGTVTIKSGQQSERVTIFQAGSHILVLTQKNYTVPSDGETITVELRSNVNYSVQMPHDDWVEAVETRSASTHTLRYRIKPNDTYDNRTAQIIFSDEDGCNPQTVTITQVQRDAILVTQTQYNFEAEGGEFTAEIASNLDFSVTTDVDWITPEKVDGTRALTTSHYRFTIGKNDGKRYRIGTIFISDGTLTQTVTVRQQGVPDAAYQIRYTTTDGKPIDYNNPQVVASNVYENGEGIITFINPVESVYGFGSPTGVAYKTLKTIVIPEGARQISSYAFAYCSALEQATVPASVEEIGNYAFAMCTALKTIDMGIESAVTRIGTGAFVSCESLEQILIPDAVTTLENTFGYCRSLKSLTFGPGSKLSNIGTATFSYCESLQSLHLALPAVPEITGEQFHGCGNLIVYVPETMVNAYVSKYPYWAILPDKYLTTKYVSTDYSADGQVVTVQTHTRGNGIQLVIMGNGFADFHQTNGTYDRVMNDAVEAFFSSEPYTSLRPYFDVYFIRTVSAHETIAEGNSTVFNRRSEDSKVLDYARKVSGLDPTKAAIGVVENFAGEIDGASGICHWYEDNAAVAYYGTGYNGVSFLTCHELCGHGFGKLDEEYIIKQGYQIEAEGIASIKNRHAQGWCENIDVTNDSSTVLWANFLTDPLYSATVGIYEGAGGCAYGVYRPSEGSFMGRGVDGDEGFNAPSRYSIWKKAMTIAGESSSWDDFVAFDAPARTNTSAPRMKAATVHNFNVTTSRPVLKNHRWTEAN